MTLTILALEGYASDETRRHGVVFRTYLKCRRISLLIAFFTGTLKLHSGDQIGDIEK